MSDLADITTAILVGGLGSRLRSEIGERPKPLADIHGRPFLTYLLEQLETAGIRHVVLCTGFRGDMGETALGSSFGEMPLEYSQEPMPLGTAGALRLALPKVRSHTVLAMNGDSYCDVNLAELWKF